MSNTNTANDVAALLAKLDSTLNNKKSKGNVDYAKLNEERKKAFWKPKTGKNQILIFTPDFSGEPFSFWGYHQGLQEVDYYSVPCDKKNKGEECLICNVVDDLKSSDWAGNKHLWAPIEQKIYTYAPIIDLSSKESMAEGPKWFRIPKTVMSQLTDNLCNLEFENGERPFYDHSQPQRILLNYDKDQAPASQYGVQFKELKDVPSEQQYADWSGSVKPVLDYMFTKANNNNKQLIDEYFLRIAEKLDSTIDDSAEDTSAAESKLSKLKK